ncbi:MAG: arylsulfatase, partial [Chloroflexota bacterium]
MARSRRDGFQGVIGRTYRDSTPWWPPRVEARVGAPNVLFIVLDDVGFAQLGCFGSDLATPRIDRLAANGLRYANFHTTALCSPTRSCLLTGRNHHSNGMGAVADVATGFPGYDALIPRANGFLSQMLVPEGYSAFAVGKWHLCPTTETSAAGSRDQWPLGRGFERFYGFLGGETNQWVPDLVDDNHPVDPPRTPAEGYHLTADLTEHAIGYVKDLKVVRPDKPFFLYFCTGAMHAPLQVPMEWIDRYRGHFDKGWDRWREEIYARQLQTGIIPPGTELSPRPPWVRAWDDLSPDERKVYARLMEVFAGFLSHTDDQIGRLLDFLDEIGELDNTLIFLLSDNGASAEGGPTGLVNESSFFNGVPEDLQRSLAALDELGSPTTYPAYPWGWAWAGDTPLKRWKRETHQGGIVDPLIVHWPRGIAARGENRRQYIHAIDLVSTVLEVIGIEPPAQIDGVTQSPIAGQSFAASFDDAQVPSRRQTQYYEMLGCRALYHEGWKVVAYHPLEGTSYSGRDPRAPFDDDPWELYHIAEDFSECHDLADQYPGKLRRLIQRWWTEAGRYDVLPLDNRMGSRLALWRPGVPPRERYVYYPGATPVPEAAAVDVRNRSFRIAARATIPTGGAEGVLLAQGSRFGGWTFFIKGCCLRYTYNYLGLAEYRIVSDQPVPTGPVELGFQFTKTGEFAGTGALLIDGKQVGEGSIPHTVPVQYTVAAGEGLCCGFDGGIAVTDEYAAP